MYLLTYLVKFNKKSLIACAVCCALGFSLLALADQMTLLQKTWLDILYLNFAYRSSMQPGMLVFSEDFKVIESLMQRMF